jgi:hypothetical protein
MSPGVAFLSGGRDEAQPQLNCAICESTLRNRVQQIRRQRGPAGLMAGAQAAPRVSMKVLVEQHQVAPMRILSVSAIAAMARPLSRFIRHK